jgi:hypothetical protein
MGALRVPQSFYETSNPAPFAPSEAMPSLRSSEPERPFVGRAPASLAGKARRGIRTIAR